MASLPQIMTQQRKAAFRTRREEPQTLRFPEIQHQSRMTTRQRRPVMNIGLLGQVREVKTTRSTTYKLDPFCTSYLEFQRRAEDEMSKLLNRLIIYGCKKQIQAKFWKTRGQPARSCNRVPYDYYYLLKHFGFYRNAPRYAGILDLREDEITSSCDELLTVRNSLAHQTYLDEEMGGLSNQLKQRSPKYTGEFIMKNIRFAKQIQRGISDSQIAQEMEIMVENLHGIQDSFEEFKQYKMCEARSTAAYSQMSSDRKKQKALDTLEAISKFIERDGSSEVTEYVATRLAARCQV